jgi:hypothetical protein
MSALEISSPCLLRKGTSAASQTGRYQDNRLGLEGLELAESIQGLSFLPRGRA